MSAPRKPPRRTRERILELSLRLFNDFGEPNVTTTTIAEEMNISPGNLYYHFKNKDDIVNGLFKDYETELDKLLRFPRDRALNVEDAWLFLHLLFEVIWKYRFLYRDLNDLLSRNRTLENHFKGLMNYTIRLASQLCEALRSSQELDANDREIEALATNMVVLATYWLSFEYVREPRKFSDPKYANQALARGVYHVLSLASPYLRGSAREHFDRLAGRYISEQ